MRLLLVLGLVFVVLGCIEPSKPSLGYSVKPCNMSEANATAFTMNESGGTVKIHQAQSYVCCANITMRMEANGTTIRVYEKNIGEMCRCICPFEADIEIKNAQGYERVEIFGIKYQDVQGYELLFNSTLAG